ncbi:hypothetical protein ED733_005572 [Metarhizium rileyi]|uniref:Uncharacterized protein n=1 Tax=Metarhizium rileyi (strain RCEF 4871) TaxID=1649241 RepID=A0A5C6GJI6_METRR|nr:hypothetical protein ED733_005572 [Metarhizium rileyi]
MSFPYKCKCVLVTGALAEQMIDYGSGPPLQDHLGAAHKLPLAAANVHPPPRALPDTLDSRHLRLLGLRIVEVIPPPVPPFGMPLWDFVDEAWDGLVHGGGEEIAVGVARQMAVEIEAERKRAFERFAALLKSSGAGQAAVARLTKETKSED